MANENTENPNQAYFVEDNDVAVQTDIDAWADRMGYHKATETTVPIHRTLRRVYIGVAAHIVRTVPDGRERALALTSLQESLMWANAAVAINLAPIALDD